MDINMPGLTGIELCILLQQRYPDIKLVALSLYSQERLIAKMINNGARAYLTKDCELDELMKAIRAVHNFGFYMNPKTMKAIQQVNNYRNKKVRKLEEITVELTSRELEILILICKEYSSQEMADKLSISVRTIEGHRNSLLLKTGCKNTAGLVLFAIRYDVFEVL
jgi:DNA-binding NarL/FixJ family response regulator